MNKILKKISLAFVAMIMLVMGVGLTPVAADGVEMGTVIFILQNSWTEEEIQRETRTGPVGTSWEAPKIKIDGYYYMGVFEDDVNSGIFALEPQIIRISYYSLIEGYVLIYLKNATTGDNILHPTEIRGNVGSLWDFEAPEVEGYKHIDSSYNGIVAGVFERGTKKVIHNYELFTPEPIVETTLTVENYTIIDDTKTLVSTQTYTGEIHSAWPGDIRPAIEGFRYHHRDYSIDAGPGNYGFFADIDRTLHNFYVPTGFEEDGQYEQGLLGVHHESAYGEANIIEEYTLNGNLGSSWSTSPKEFNGWIYEAVYTDNVIMPAVGENGFVSGHFDQTEDVDKYQHITYTYRRAGTLIVEYRDKNTNEVILPTVNFGKKVVGTVENINAPGKIGDYIYHSATGELAYVVEQFEQTVIVYYTKDDDPYIPPVYEDVYGQVTIKYQDTDAKALFEDINLTGLVGKAWMSEEKTFTGYTFKEVVGDTEGEFKTDKQTTIYVYTKNIEEPTVIRVDITGNKVWVLGPEIKPIIELQLYRNGLVYGDPVELRDGATSYTWNNLEKTDDQGNEYIYTIDEVSTPENYDKLISEDGLTVTNVFFEVAGDVVIDDEKDKPAGKPVDKTPPTGINNYGYLYATTFAISSAGLVLLRKRKEEEI